MAARILFAGITSTRITRIADGTWFPAVIRAILEDEVAVITPRKCRDDGVRVRSD